MRSLVSEMTDATTSSRSSGASASASASKMSAWRGSLVVWMKWPSPGTLPSRRMISAMAASAPWASASTKSSWTVRLAAPWSGPATAPSPARTTAWGPARVEAASRAARVDVAMPWSARATSTVSRRGHPSSGPSARRTHNRWAIRSSSVVPRSGSESTMARMRRRPVAVAPSALRSSRNGSTAPAATTPAIIRSVSVAWAGSAATARRTAPARVGVVVHATCSDSRPSHSRPATCSYDTPAAARSPRGSPR